MTALKMDKTWWENFLEFILNPVGVKAASQWFFFFILLFYISSNTIMFDSWVLDGCKNR